MKKTVNKDKPIILERGDIYFFYRPRVIPATEKASPKRIKDIQRFYFILHPENTRKYRLIIVGEKKLPTIESMHEKDWALVDLVTTSRNSLLKDLDKNTYQTQTRGKRILPAVRPAGEGVYCIISRGRNTYLTYALELCVI